MLTQSCRNAGFSVYPLLYNKALQGALQNGNNRKTHLQKTGTILKEMQRINNREMNVKR